MRAAEGGTNLSFDLHRLTARMDRAADRILGEAMRLSYRRFLALLLVQELGSPTQRALADALEVSEPSVSRMTAVLVGEGYLDVGVPAEGGNRRQLTLTPAGKQAVTSAGDLLEARFAELVTRSHVPYAAYSRYTRALLDTLDSGPEAS